MEIANSTSIKTRTKPSRPGQNRSGGNTPTPQQAGSGTNDAMQQRRAIPPHHTSAPADLAHSISNAFDGMALLEIAEDGIKRMLSALQKGRELTLHAAQEELHSEVLSRLQRQLQHQLDLMDGIAHTTSFKGLRIFHGGLGCVDFQVDLNTTKMLGINLDASIRRTALGAAASATSANIAGLFGTTNSLCSYTTPPITDLNFFTTARHAIFSIDGIPTGMFRDWRGKPQAAATDLQSRLNMQVGTARYTVTYSEQRFTISSNSDHAPVLSAASIRGNEFVSDMSLSAPHTQKLILGANDLSIKVGDEEAIDVKGHFSNIDELVFAINQQVLRVQAYATHHPERIVIGAHETLTISGNRAHQTDGMGFETRPIPPSGNLDQVTLFHEEGQIDALQRIDAALTTLAAQQAGYREIRQRFEEALAEMQAKSAEAAARHILHAAALTDSLSQLNDQILQKTESSMQA